jgi:hypothetical protein
MIINLSLADLIVLVAFSALVGMALGMALWRPSRRERRQTEAALLLQATMRARAQHRLAEAASQDRLDAARYATAFLAPFEEHRRG